MNQLFSFEIILQEKLTLPTDLDWLETMANRLYEAGGDDCMPSTCGGVIAIGFAREATSLGAAIDSAVDLYAANL